jgi:hypothetical protein
MSDYKFKISEIRDLRSEEGAEELMSPPEMQPYLHLGEAAMLGRDIDPAMQEIADLPLKKRYVWRVASSLKSGFADFDDLSVMADWETLSEEDSAKVIELLRLRPIQFCIFLKALFGAEEMERLLLHGIAVAKEQANSPFHRDVD